MATTSTASARRGGQMKTDICSVPGCGKPYSSKGYCKIHAERVRRHGHPYLTGPFPGRPLAERFWKRVEVREPEECWPWTGALTPQGYGRIRTGGTGTRTIGAHRAAYLLAHPDEDSPEVVDHLCHDPQTCDDGPTCAHRRCCNPAHLGASTFQENSAADRQWTRAQLTRCKHGHPFTPANTYIWVSPRGEKLRRCRACDAARRRERAAS